MIIYLPCWTITNQTYILSGNNKEDFILDNFNGKGWNKSLNFDSDFEIHASVEEAKASWHRAGDGVYGVVKIDLDTGEVEEVL
jgi:hypothetical protein